MVKCSAESYLMCGQIGNKVSKSMDVKKLNPSTKSKGKIKESEARAKQLLLS